MEGLSPELQALVAKADEIASRIDGFQANICLNYGGRDDIVQAARRYARDFADGKTLIQPAIDFEYEVSFYFSNDRFEYAMYAPDKSRRWELKAYTYSDEDIAFAETFIRWNTIKSGIQRVDACRTKDGRLLLVELEDLNPYLSVLEVDPQTRDRFMHDFISALKQAM